YESFEFGRPNFILITLNILDMDILNKNILKSLVVIIILTTGACNNSILDQNPQDSYSDPVVFSDPKLVEYYLNALYNDINYGWNQRGHGYQTGVFVGRSEERRVGNERRTRGW